MKKARLIAGALATLLVVGALAFWFMHRGSEPGAQPGPRSAGAEPARAYDKKPAETVEPESGQAQRAQADSEGARHVAIAAYQLIEEICGPNAYSRLRELERSGPVSRAECEALYRFIAAKTTDEKLERMAGIKNAVMNILARQQNLPARWDTLLRRILEDQDQHTVIRDYALQHLFSWYEESLDKRGVAKLDETERNELRELFWRMLDDRQMSFGGTALLGLYHLAAFDPSVDAARLSQESAELLQASDSSPLVQVSAFQVSALLGERRALSQAIEVAQHGQNIALRVSAIAALGALGGRDELVVLRGLLPDTNPSVRAALQSAINRLEPRTNGL